MSRRARAAAFLAAALACAALAAALASRYSSSVADQFGPLRPVVVAGADLEPGTPIGPEEVSRSLAVRRVPARFVPVGALRRPQDALGRAPAAAIPAGAYVLSSQLVVPAAEPVPAPAAGHGLRPLQIGVAGAEALMLGGGDPTGARVDVVVARRGGLGQSASTEIAAEGVELLALRGPAGPGDGWSATLALTRAQALALIGAEAGGREVRLLPRP